jgi:hypothetical protein
MTTPTLEAVSEAVSREERMIVIARDESGKPTIWCDPEIVDLVTALNAGGVPTVASCSGHGHRPGSIALKDGRWLVVAKDDAEHDAIEAIFLTDINGDPITPKHPLSDDGLRAIAGKQFGINDPDLCAQLAAELLASRTQSPAEWEVEAAWARAERMSADTYIQNKSALREILKAVEAARSKLIPNEYPENIERAASIPAPERSKEETVEVRVKPLEWEEDEIGWWCAQPQAMIGGSGYEVRVTDRGQVRSRRGREDWAAFDGTLEEAKAAAQQDFENRIISALETPPLHKEGEADAYKVTDKLARYMSKISLVLADDAIVPSLKLDTERFDLTPLYAAPVPVPVTITDEMVDAAHSVIEKSFQSEPWVAGPPSLLARAALTAALSQKPGEQG